MADGEEVRELRVRIPALRVEILTGDLQCQARVSDTQLRSSVAVAYTLECVVEQQMQNQRILFSKNGNGLPD
jgi:hypothetical protein